MRFPLDRSGRGGRVDLTGGDLRQRACDELEDAARDERLERSRDVQRREARTASECRTACQEPGPGIVERARHERDTPERALVSV
jgi:hypothetical protein